MGVVDMVVKNYIDMGGIVDNLLKLSNALPPQ